MQTYSLHAVKCCHVKHHTHYLVPPGRSSQAAHDQYAYIMMHAYLNDNCA